MSRYEISSYCGSHVEQAGDDYRGARAAAQSKANVWEQPAYLYERGAPEDDYEMFEPVFTPNYDWAIVDSGRRILGLYDTIAEADVAGWGHDRELVRLTMRHELNDVIEYNEKGVEQPRTWRHPLVSPSSQGRAASGPSQGRK